MAGNILMRGGKVATVWQMNHPRPKNYIHGQSKKPSYRMWRHMLDRCYDPNYLSYSRYGGRGITVCESWKSNFVNFWADMGPAYFPGASIDRKDNNLGYYKDNCQWSTIKHQNRNRRDNVFIQTPLGRMCLVEAAEKFNIPIRCIEKRRAKGWPEDKLLLKPQLQLNNPTHKHRFGFGVEVAQPCIHVPAERDTGGPAPHPAS